METQTFAHTEIPGKHKAENRNIYSIYIYSQNKGKQNKNADTAL